MAKGNRFAEAFKENFNLLGLASAAAASAALLNPLPLLAGLAAEAAYLLFVPDSGWYERRLARRHEAEIEAQRLQLRNQIFPMLDSAMQDRFTRLEATRTQIQAQAKDDQEWFQEVLRKLDYLLEKFLLFAGKEAQFRSYLPSLLMEARRASGRPPQPRPDVNDEDRHGGGRRNDRDRRDRRRIPINVPPPERPPAPPPFGSSDGWVQQVVAEVQAHYDREITQLRERQEQEQDANTKAILEKRVDVLQQRHEHVGRIGKILINLTHQIELLEDTFGLINDQIRARSPEQVLADIESVVYQTDSMTRLLDEIAPFEQMAQRLAA